MKKYKIMYNVGCVKYCLTFSDGLKKHKDDSMFWDMMIFKNKNKMNKYIKDNLKDFINT